MTREQAIEIIEAACRLLFANDRILLENGVTERALSHHLAAYMKDLVPDGFHVDAEYNRDGFESKRLNLPPRSAIDSEIRATTVYPDVIVHKRGTNEHNHLVVEMKKPGESLDYDDLKLRAFRKELKYDHCCHLILGLRADGGFLKEIRWVEGE